MRSNHRSADASLASSLNPRPGLPVPSRRIQILRVAVEPMDLLMEVTPIDAHIVLNSVKPPTSHSEGPISAG